MELLGISILISVVLVVLLVGRVDRHQPAGLRLARHAVRRRQHSGGHRARHQDLGQRRVVDAGRAAALHLDGRDPVPHQAVGGDVRGPGAVAGGFPGRLLHVNVLGCGIFGSVSGSSAATCATIAKIALPELKKRGYAEMIALGSLAGAGTLGILIPPSITMVVYAVAANVSIIKVFLAGFLPGLLRDGALSPATSPSGHCSIPTRCRRRNRR